MLTLCPPYATVVWFFVSVLFFLSSYFPSLYLFSNSVDNILCCRLIEDFVRDLMLNNDHIHVMEQQMRDAIIMGLKKEHQEDASVKCFPTYVKEFPNGKEQGKFLSLDLGGTNFRVILMELTKNKEFMMDSKIFAIPHSVMIGPGIELFNHITE